MIKPVEPHDYLIFKLTVKESAKSEILLLRVSSVSKPKGSDNFEYTGCLETKTVHIKPQTVTVEHKNVLLNLGRKPQPGKMYGHNLGSLYLGAAEVHKEFPEVHIFEKPTKANREILTSSVDHIVSLLKRKRLGFMLAAPITWELRPQTGKYSGYYLHSRNPEKSPHRISIACNEKTRSGDNARNLYTYVLAHELGHALHFQYVDTKTFPKLNAKWVSLYRTSISSQEIEAATRKRILKEATSAEDLNAYYKHLNEDDKQALKVLMREVWFEHKLHWQEVCTLHSARPEYLAELWPTHSVFDTAPKPILTDYATKNFRELFAESFAYWLLDLSQPSVTYELMEKSVSTAIQSNGY